MRIRPHGGGRQSSLEASPEVAAAFLRVREHDTAGSPLNAEGKWTHRTSHEMAAPRTAQAMPVGVPVVTPGVPTHPCVRRTAQQRQRAGAGAPRDAPGATIAQPREAEAGRPKPLLSRETKPKR